LEEVKITNKEINRLALPAIISGIAEPLISLVDTFFVGQLGTEALAGVGYSGVLQASNLHCSVLLRQLTWSLYYY